MSRTKNFKISQKSSKVCDILKTHSEDLKEDPERLKSDFLLHILLENDKIFTNIINSISSDDSNILKNSDIIKYFLQMAPFFQKKIINECERVKNFTAISFLGNVLISNSKENQIIALKILKEIGTEKAFEQILLGYQNKSIHLSIKSSFREKGTEYLIKFAQYRNPIIRFNTMIALGGMGEDAFEPLKLCLLYENVILRRIAANALGDLGNLKSLQLKSLVSLLNAQNDSDDEVRKRVCESIYLICQKLDNKEIDNMQKEVSKTINSDKNLKDILDDYKRNIMIQPRKINPVFRIYKFEKEIKIHDDKKHEKKSVNIEEINLIEETLKEAESKGMTTESIADLKRARYHYYMDEMHRENLRKQELRKQKNRRKLSGSE